MPKLGPHDANLRGTDEQSRATLKLATTKLKSLFSGSYSILVATTEIKTDMDENNNVLIFGTN